MNQNTRVDTRDMLVLGAGQLGLAVLRELAPRLNERGTPVAALVAPNSIVTPNELEERTNTELRSLGVELVPLDLAHSSQSDLAAVFKRYRTIVGCTGFVAGPGTQLKITRAVLDAGVPRYFPWQFGVDYDIVGKGSGQPVFDEQYEVRTLLRSQDKTEWVIVSTGMFTSFLFEPSFDVVNLAESTIHALGSWETQVTVTTPEDIGRLTTEIILEEPRIVKEIVYVAGDTISYGHLADVVEGVTGRKFERVQWSLDKLRADLTSAPDDVMARYRAAFALGDGMWWDKEKTYNARKGIRTTTVEDWLRVHVGEDAE